MPLSTQPDPSPSPNPKSTHQEEEETETEALFASLENETPDTSYNASRISQLNAELAAAKSSLHSNSNSTPNGTDTPAGGDTYPTLPSDSALLSFTTNSHRCVVHFSHPDFSRCAVMDEHLAKLASRHHEVRFARVDVQATPFVVEKLKIRVLPCVVGFRGGIAVDRVTGFEGLGAGGRDGKDGFSSAVLEKRLVWKGILVKEKIAERDGSDYDDDDDDESGQSESEDDGRNRRAIRGAMRPQMDDDDDWD